MLLILNDCYCVSSTSIDSPPQLTRVDRAPSAMTPTSSMPIMLAGDVGVVAVSVVGYYMTVLLAVLRALRDAASCVGGISMHIMHL
jgi:hypothetical protein